MSTLRIVVACHNASGMPDLPIINVAATSQDIDEGRYYDRAIALAEDAGYQGPFVCFDANEYRPILSAARQLDLVPQVVVVDITEGLVQSVCCDTGAIKVICYDESDIDESSEAVVDLPVGEHGQVVHCWAHVQMADIDPELKGARD